MKSFETFADFLRRRCGNAEVGVILREGIEHPEYPGTEDVNNLFAVSQHFMKCGTADPHLLLKALVSSYQRWILSHLRELSTSMERCIAANRVVFIEDGKESSNSLPIWRDLNATLTDLSGNIQDFGVISNYISLNQDIEKSHKPAEGD